MRISGTGGEYQFLRTTLGRLPAFLFGWMRLTVGPAVIAALAVAFTVFMSHSTPIGGPWLRWTMPWGSGATHLDFGPRQGIALSIIAGLAWINSRGVRAAGSFQLAVSAAILAAMSAYNGWANAAILGGEIREPARVLPWALVCGVGFVTILYVATNAAFLHALPLQDITTANSTAYPTAASVASRATRHVLGTAHCNMLAVPRVFFSMARDGLLPQSLSLVAIRSGTPNRAIAMFAALASIFAVVGSYDRLTNMTAFSFLLFFVLTSLGFLWSRRTILPASRNPKYWATIAFATAFLLGSVWLIVTSVLRGSIEVQAALGLVGSGFPIFILLERLRSRGKLKP